MVAQKFVKEVLRPGLYVKGDREILVTAQDCRDYFRSLGEIHKNGLGVPLLYEHTDPERERGEGTPEYMGERAEQLRRTVGRVAWGDPGNKINETGGIELVLEVPDPGAARQLSSGLIEFVSPELRPHWRDGKGREYQKLLSHVALTHRPIQVDQKRGFVQLAEISDRLSEMTVPVQLSISELIGGAVMAKNANARQLADDEEEKKKKVGEKSEAEKAEGDDAPPVAEKSEPPAEEVKDGLKEAAKNLVPTTPEEKPEEVNPDMPKAGGAEDRKQFEALLAHLSKAGFVLPSDTSLDNLVSRLLTAAMTLNAAEEKKEPEEQGVPATEQSPSNISQMSDADVAGERAKVAYRIRRLAERGILQPGVAERLLPRASVLQFSSDGSEVASSGTTLSGILDAFEGGASLVHSLLKDETQGYQFSDGSKGSELSHPREKTFFGGSEMLQPGDAESARVAGELLERHGMRRGNVHTSLNASSVLGGGR